MTLNITPTPILPRFIRLRNAPHYLGMDRNRFKAEVRPYVTEIKMGIQGVAFDRLELDAWAEQYKSRNGRPGQPMGDQSWDARKRPDFNRRAKVKSGTSTKESKASELSSLLEQAASTKRKDT